jgi:hypothetical protein
VQALDCLVKAGADSGTAARLVSPDMVAAAPLQAFLAAVAEQHADILSDGLGLMQVIKHLLPQVKARTHGACCQGWVSLSKMHAILRRVFPELRAMLNRTTLVLFFQVCSHVQTGLIVPAS